MTKDQRDRSGIADRIRFFSYKGKRILLVDMTNSKPREVEDIARKVPDYVTAESRGSVLILTDFTRASFDQDALRTMQQSAVFDKPFVKKSALIGGRDPSATVLRRHKELLPARTADFQKSRRSSRVAGVLVNSGASQHP